TRGRGTGLPFGPLLRGSPQDRFLRSVPRRSSRKLAASYPGYPAERSPCRVRLPAQISWAPLSPRPVWGALERRRRRCELELRWLRCELERRRLRCELELRWLRCESERSWPPIGLSREAADSTQGR